MKLIELDSFPTESQLNIPMPPRAADFLQQAIDSMHAPDGAMMLAASAIDAMLKDKGYKVGSLNARIEKATGDGCLIPELADWAHEVRLDANAVRHADDTFQKTTEGDARQSVEFAKTLAELWYGLPARIATKRTEAGTGGDA